MTFEELLKIREREGKREGLAEAIFELLTVHGEIPEEIREKVLAEANMETLKNWLLLASKVTSIDAFVQGM